MSELNSGAPAFSKSSDMSHFEWGDHSRLLIALALLTIGFLVYYIPFFSNFSDWRPLIAGAAFGGALTELINDLHNAEDRRQQRKIQLMQELRHNDLHEQNEHLHLQNDQLQSGIAYLRAQHPNLHPCEHALRLGSRLAQMHLRGQVRGGSHLRQHANIRAIAKMLNVQDLYDKANQSLREDEKLNREQWAELLMQMSADLRRQSLGAQEAFTTGYKIEKLAIRLRAPIKAPDPDDIQNLRTAIDLYRLAEPFKSWAFSNLNAAFAPTALVQNSRMFLHLLASMLSFSHYLRESIDGNSLASSIGIDSTDAEMFEKAESRLGFGASARLSIRDFFNQVIRRFPDIQLAEPMELERIMIPQTSDPNAYVF